MKSSNSHDTFEPSCRSTVIIGDIFEYVRHFHSGTAPIKYDFIITDIYDEKVVLYDGTNNSFSNAGVMDGIGTLAQLKSILKPNAGTIFFHLHHDNQSDTYEDAIKQTFQGTCSLIHSFIHIFSLVIPRVRRGVDVGTKF